MNQPRLGQPLRFLDPAEERRLREALEKLSINVAVETSSELKNVYSPTHAINTQRPDNKHAVVKFEVTNAVPTTDFRLFCDTADGKLGASLLSYRPDANDEGAPRLAGSDPRRRDRAVRRVRLLRRGHERPDGEARQRVHVRLDS